MIDLGKYAFNVLVAYGIGLGLLIGFIWISLGQAKRAKTELQRLHEKNNRSNIVYPISKADP